MDRTHHDFVGTGNGFHGIHPYLAPILFSALLSRRSRGWIPARSYHLSYPLVSLSGSSQSRCLLLCGQPNLLCNRIATGGIASWSFLAWHERLALALHHRGNPRSHPGSYYYLVPDRLAARGSLAPR